MRRLYRKKALSLVKELDAFPKVPESYVETTATGGTVSLIAFTAMALLAFFEFFVYRDTWMKYEYEVDKDFSSKLRINIDITVAMKCQHVGADILDLAETMITSNGIQYEPVIFELTGFHQCIAAYDFSHRIDHVSFGEEIPGIINPLDGTEKITSNHNEMFQYFITVVPTKLHTSKVSADKHQFSVTERERVINHAAGSHGVSGIFMKYDTSSLMVMVSEQHMPLWQFLKCTLNIFIDLLSPTGMIHGFVGFCFDIVCCRFKLGPYKPRGEPSLLYCH
uniref:Endoplasmic reticulum-Golgi intermediate compartment protein n=1 Tax=Oncorhynchus tshawytscha TaxID=74940 RepID=A0A8C8I176_ONCTS